MTKIWEVEPGNEAMCDTGQAEQGFHFEAIKSQSGMTKYGGGRRVSCHQGESKQSPVSWEQDCQLSGFHSSSQRLFG